MLLLFEQHFENLTRRKARIGILNFSKKSENKLQFLLKNNKQIQQAMITLQEMAVFNSLNGS